MKRVDKAAPEKRTVTVPVRVTVTEKTKLKQLADEAGFTLSDWIRNKAIGSKPLLRKPSPDREIMLRFLASFGKAASNLNQLQRSINRKQHSEEFELPLATINYLLGELKTVTDKLRNVFRNDNQG